MRCEQRVRKAPQPGMEQGDGYRFRVTANAGTSSVLGSTLMRDEVDAVRASGSTLNLELRRSGTVAYDKVKAFN